MLTLRLTSRCTLSVVKASTLAVMFNTPPSKRALQLEEDSAAMFSKSQFFLT